MIEIVLVLLIVLGTLPFVVYVSVKLGTYAFYRGRQIFEKENENGESKRRT
jgi:hypothetical protein